ncbi:putative hydroxypyruvate isomerase [Babylonia areolata]|uniref:putative hydroxypyruvate isomerase n=1 Tax=Babylonia areolata TaxID=304850 RepID=UPI003FD5E95C
MLQGVRVTRLAQRGCVRTFLSQFAQFSTDSKRNMPLKFAANISTMFQEIPSLAERYTAAKQAGFQAVEAVFPYSENVDSLSRAREESGLEHVLINSFPGDVTQGELGLAALPDKVDIFREKLELTIKYAKALGCKRIHVMAAKKPPNCDEATLKQMEATFIDNLRYSADRLQKEGILALIEAVNDRISMPGYFLNHPHKAFQIVKKINHPNLKVQFDVFHVQIMDGNITHNLKEQFPYIGHIQISQAPDRGEPDTRGEICFTYIFRLLEELGYEGYIGCEYKPRGSTLDGLKWMKDL